MPDALTDTQKAHGLALQRAHGFLESNPTMTIGEAVRHAVEAADVSVPQDVQDAMVQALGKLLFRGFPSDIDA